VSIIFSAEFVVSFNKFSITITISHCIAPLAILVSGAEQNKITTRPVANTGALNRMLGYLFSDWRCIGHSIRSQITGTEKWLNSVHRRSQDFFWGALFFPQNVDLFLVVALKTRQKYLIINLSRRQHLPNFLKDGLLLVCLGGGLSAWGALTTFSCKFGQEKKFRPWGVHVHPVQPLTPTMIFSHFKKTGTKLPALLVWFPAIV